MKLPSFTFLENDSLLCTGLLLVLACSKDMRRSAFLSYDIRHITEENTGKTGNVNEYVNKT